MIKWGESIRDAEPDFFCRATIPSTCIDDVVIISDCRRPTDIEYFQTNYRTLTVRIEASIEERVRRGFVFTEGIDDMPSECALDEYEHDMTIVNDQSRDFSREIENVTDHIKAIL
ncbi:putative phosphomevalonate kinase [Ancylostoma caninum]|uniref:Phosphomevalonate kinase n=1 Tax=Ancylostoma caninum TaxID=29170 RepID=A0A368GBY4_ANCCA|nr:putative phosphomevalonate kinase [Ancylostoma caninum]